MVVTIVNSENAVDIKSIPVTIEVSHSYEFYSDVLEEDRELLVHLPEGYNESEKYDVIYLLDGTSHFNHASIATSILYRTQGMPEIIVVAIPNTDNSRSRGFSVNKDNFIGFIAQEIFPFVEKITACQAIVRYLAIHWLLYFKCTCGLIRVI